MAKEEPQIRTLLEPLIRERGIRATARRLGISPASLSLWLNGTRGISEDVIERLLRAFKLRIDIHSEEDDAKPN